MVGDADCRLRRQSPEDVRDIAIRIVMIELDELDETRNRRGPGGLGVGVQASQLCAIGAPNFCGYDTRSRTLLTDVRPARLCPPRLVREGTELSVDMSLEEARARLLSIGPPGHLIENHPVIADLCYETRK